jgi:hypothetical protein
MYSRSRRSNSEDIKSSKSRDSRNSRVVIAAAIKARIVIAVRIVRIGGRVIVIKATVIKIRKIIVV